MTKSLGKRAERLRLGITSQYFAPSVNATRLFVDRSALKPLLLWSVWTAWTPMFPVRWVEPRSASMSAWA